MMIIEIENREVEVDENDINSLLSMLTQPAVQPPSTVDAVRDMLSEGVPKVLSSIEMMFARLSEDVTKAVQSQPPVVIPAPKEPVKTKPVKRILVGDIERGQGGLITSCVLEIQR